MMPCIFIGATGIILEGIFVSMCEAKGIFNPEMEAVFSSKALVPVHKTKEDVNWYLNS